MSDSVEKPNKSYDAPGVDGASAGDVVDGDFASDETKARVNEINKKKD